MITKRADDETKALIHAQAQFHTALNKDGTTRVMMNHSPCAPVVGNIDLIGLCDEAAFSPLQPCPGLEVRTAYDFCGPDKDSGCRAIVDLPVMVAGLDLRREVFFDHPLVAPYAVAPGAQYQEAALLASAREAQAELLQCKAEAPFKKMVSWDNIADKANKAVVANPKGLCVKDLILMKKIDLTAPVHNPIVGFLADNANKADCANLNNPAARGAPAYIFFQAAVPFQVMQRM